MRKSCVQNSRSHRLLPLVPDSFRIDDRERELFFREIGILADKYCRKPRRSTAQRSAANKHNEIKMFQVASDDPVPEFPRQWAEGIRKRVGLHFVRKRPGLVNQLEEEFTNEYNRSLVHLSYSNKNEGRSGARPQEYPVLPLDEIRCGLEVNLLGMNGKVQKIIGKFQSECHKVGFTELSVLEDNSATAEDLTRAILDQVTELRDNLVNIARCTQEKIILVGPQIFKRKKTTSASKLQKVVSTIISLQLQTVASRILKEIMAYVTGVKCPLIRVEFTYNDKGELFVSPEPNEIEARLLGALDQVTEILSSIMNSYQSCTPKLKLTLPIEVIRECKCAVENYIHNCARETGDYLLLCRTQYSGLWRPESVNRDFADEELCINETSFRLHDDKRSQVYLVTKHVEFYYGTNLRVDLRRMKQHLITKIRSSLTGIEEAFLAKFRIETAELQKALEEMKMQILSAPSTTSELMNRSGYLEEARTKRLQNIITRVHNLKKNFVQLTSFVTFPVTDVENCAVVFEGPDEISPLFDSVVEVLAEHRHHFEEKYQETLEKTQKDLKRLREKIKVFNTLGDYESVGYYVKDIQAIMKKLVQLEQTATWINQEEVLLKYPFSAFPDISDIKAYLEPFAKLYSVALQWRKSVKLWLDGDFLRLNAETIENTTDELAREMFKLQKIFRSKWKLQENSETVGKNRFNVDSTEASQLPPPLRICYKAIEDIKSFKVNLPLVTVLCNPGLRSRHWEDMSTLVGNDLTPNAGTSLRKLLRLDLMRYLEQFETVSGAASKEFSLERTMKSMAEEWINVQFSVTRYRDSDTIILAGVDEIQAILDDHLVKTQTMKGSPFVRPVEEQLTHWENTLIRIQRTIDEFLSVQGQWLYLEPIFSSPNIIEQMPKEAGLFREVDETWRVVMNAVRDNLKVMQTAGKHGMLEHLTKSSELLEQINHGVNTYLEKKRLYFSRFFFLSNEEMLEILSETKDPLRVQPHLKKCFEGIASLDFDEDHKIHGMISPQGEQISFHKPIDTNEARGSVEQWLLQVQENMSAAVQHEIVKSLEICATSTRQEWVSKVPGQAVLCAAQVQWTAAITKAISQGLVALKDYHQQIQGQLRESATLVQMPLPDLARITLGALVVTEVHTRDVIQDLIDKKVSDIQDFHWIAQLRYYVTGEDAVEVQMINASLRYANEYLGNTTRLVITPLTDRCYRTLIGAYHLHLSGAPEGPAGTGKTETTKDLAKALAVQCLVFNCSDGLDYVAMGKFFKGLACAGAWACFDEFNRIEPEVLSVVAQQMLCILTAMQAHLPKFLFEGTELNLNPMCFVCVTMNPGYAGRSELPDNLRVLFRTVAMMIPDYAMIGEISLYSYGFTHARALATKIVTTYRLCSEQLSTQSHYDYGMRAVKAVLVAAGNLKVRCPDDPEESLILRSLLDVNLPKFLAGDLTLFQGIIADLFPSVTLPNTRHAELSAAIQHVCNERNLLATEKFVQKVIQMYETMLVRHGFMLVGSPMGGKTDIIQVLAAALNHLSVLSDGHTPGVVYRTLNPKAVCPGLLFGQFDPITHEWIDGIVSRIFREMSTSTSSERKWIIFDGPVDAVWIENLNTVLDDNKKLCLTSGEIIPLTPSMSVIFEVMDLTQASPATVSRCGMVYVDPRDLGWEPLVHTWLKSFSATWRQNTENMLISLTHWIIPAALNYVRRFGVEIISVEQNSQVRFLLRTFQTLMQRACAGLKEVRYARAWLQASLLFATTWTIGGILDSESRIKFDSFLRSLVSGKNESFPYPPNIGRWECHLPPDGTSYDYVYEYKQRGQWRQWAETVRNMSLPETSCLRRIVVPTADTARYSFLLELGLLSETPMLLVGPTGTGKTLCILEKMSAVSEQQYSQLCSAFTAQTTSAQVQDLIVSHLERRKKGLMAPPAGKKCLVFIDDLNMPAKETYGAQPPIELLRQYFDYQQWYDRKDASPLLLRDVHFLAAMGPPGGSRQNVSPRFLRHFHVVAINPFSDTTMIHIFSTILTIHLKNGGFPPDVLSLVESIVNATLEVYRSAVRTLLPTPSKSHYVFNLRDFARVIHGCCLVKKEAADNRKIFIRLWVHEVLRVFGDRLVNENDSSWLYAVLRDCVRNNFRENFDALLEHLGRIDGKVPMSALDDLLFGDYLVPDLLYEDRNYEEILDISRIYSILQVYINDYNNTNKVRLNLVVFRYVLKHLSRISRVLRIAGGHALLIGLGGSGRQSLTKLAASMSGFPLFQPSAKANYGFVEWREDVKRVLRVAGGQGKDVVFLILDTQLQNTTLLQDVDSLLNSGEVPNLFSVEEKQEIIELVRASHRHQEPSGEASTASLMSLFSQRCRDKLHLVLAFSPLGSTLQNCVRYFPSLINCCTIDWFEVWPDEALEKVAENYIGNVCIGEDVKHPIVEICKHFHTAASKFARLFTHKTRRPVYITPASYLTLLEVFGNLMMEQKRSVQSAIERYRNGLARLAEASEQVNRMQTELSELQPKLVEASEQVEKMMVTIEQESNEVERASLLVRADEVAANQQASVSQALKAECEADLAEALPALEAALAALDTLKPADITLVKSMKNPPRPIKTVMAAVCVMKDVKPEKILDPAGSGKKVYDYWGPSKKILNDIGFLTQLKEYNKDNIAAHIMSKIRSEFLPNPEFNPAVVAKASSAAEGLCKWVKAIEMYDRAAKVVLPKKARLSAAEASLAETMALLDEKRAQVAQLEARLAKLKADYEEGCRRREQLASDVDSCAKRLTRAEALVGGLGQERERWSEAQSKYESRLESLAGDVLLAAACIAYLGPFTSAFRDQIIAEWSHLIRTTGIPCTEKFSLSSTLGSAVQIEIWTEAGLPRDNFSIDNAVMMYNQQKWPLLIDPQGQATQWLKNLDRSRGLVVIQPTQSDWLRVLETCLPAGRPVLFEDVGEQLDPTIEPLLSRSINKQGGLQMIQLGDSMVEYNPEFQLYLTTKLRNPHYLPEVSTKVAIINASITLEGLEDQLLSIVVAQERPELEVTRQNLVKEGASCRTALQEVEDRILETLATTDGNLLENESAIHVLNASKALSEEISKKQDLALQTASHIEESRRSYFPVAKHATILFFCVAELGNVDPMYQYSLNWFIRLYLNSISTSKRSEDVTERLEILQDHFTYALYCNVCRSLFEKDKLAFSLALVTSIMRSKGLITFGEMEYFTNFSGGTNTAISANGPQWLNSGFWGDICYLASLAGFESITTSLLENPEWETSSTSTNPYEKQLPTPWEENLSPFRKLLVCRYVFPDKIIPMVRSFVSSQMGPNFVRPPSFDLGESFSDSSAPFPLIFLLTSGADPMECLLRFAEEKGFSGPRLHIVSLGQGQGVLAEQKIDAAKRSGEWVILQNCHLAASWMPSLERICETLRTEVIHEDFRLWLTSYPSEEFPTSILQNGIKITNEPPVGLKENLMRTFKPDPLERLANDPAITFEKHLAMRKLTFSLCFFHALVQERRTYGAIGWNIPYAFDDSDLKISLRQLQIFIKDYPTVPYDALTYLIGECHYGGRVTDDWDRRTLHTLLVDFCHEDLVKNEQQSLAEVSHELYTLPHSTNYKDFLQFIESLPQVQHPAVFGLHDNVTIVRDLQDGKKILTTLLSLQSCHIGGSQENNLKQDGSLTSSSATNTDAKLADIVNDLIYQLPANFDLDLAARKFPISYSEPLNTVLVQEMGRYNSLLSVIRANLLDLQKAVAGHISMTAELEVTAALLLKNHLPKLWKAASYPSLKPMRSYINDLKERVKFFRDWFDLGQPAVFSLPAFSFPQSFLTAVLQTAARLRNIPVDRVVHHCTVIEPSAYSGQPPENGVYIGGLFLVGAGWDYEKHCLCEQRPKVLSEGMPMLWLFPHERNSDETQASNEYQFYECPIYRTSDRHGTLSTTGHSTNFILSLPLPTVREPEHWVKRGVALLCQLDE